MENKILSDRYEEGLIEVEGNEDFVSKELDKFFRKNKK